MATVTSEPTHPHRSGSGTGTHLSVVLPCATTAVASNHYFRSIDGLRILAAVNIVLFHLAQVGGLHAMGGRPGWFFTIVRGPMFHATLFFILAGFIYTIKYAAYADRFNTRRFFISRLKALYPLHVLTTLSMVPFILMNTAPIPWGRLFLSLFMHLGLLWSLYPIGTFDLNTPSWALSAFFFCYLLFGPALKLVVRCERRRSVFAALILCMLPTLLWIALYAQTGFSQPLHRFFHVFAPVRFFEFVLGMLLARLYQVSTHKTGETGILNRGWVNDLAIVVTFILLFVNLSVRSPGSPWMHWITYRVTVLGLFAFLLYRFARGHGLFPAFTAIPVVRLWGQCSFYPYLLHIPLSSWLCYALGEWFGYRTFLHHPLTIALFIVALYGISAWYWHHRGRARRRAHVMAGARGSG